MPNVKFSTLAVGDQFVFKGVSYTKTTPKKISCCRSLNAMRLDNNEKVMIRPIDVVEKVEPTSDNK